MLRIAIVGLMKSGKGVIKDHLVDYHGFTADAFAAPVKRASVAAINAALVDMGEEPFMNLELLERDKTLLRGMPQFIGTELGRNYVGPQSIWIDKLVGRLHSRLPGDSEVVVDDCRFLNEAAALRKEGFTIWRVERPEALRYRAIIEELAEKNPDWVYSKLRDKAEAMMSHGSEVEAPLIEPDYLIHNEATVQDLREEVDEVVDHMRSVR